MRCSLNRSPPDSCSSRKNHYMIHFSDNVALSVCFGKDKRRTNQSLLSSAPALKILISAVRLLL